MISLAVVLLALVVVYSFLIPRMRPKDRRFKSGYRPIRSFSDLAKAQSVDGAASWVTTFLGLLAITSLVPAGDSSGVSTGAVIGTICGLIVISDLLIPMRDFALSVIGGVAAVFGAIQLLARSECGGTTASTVALLSMALLALATGLFISLLRSFRNLRVSGFQAFVVVEFVTFLVAPLGVDLTSDSMWVAIVAAILGGLLVGASPDAVLGLLGLGIGVVTLWASTQTSDGCGVSGSPDSVVLVVSGMVAYFIASAGISIFKH